jgi:outer membrane protein TolC
MLRAALGRRPDEPIPEVVIGAERRDPPKVGEALAQARRHRPELAAMRAEIDQAAAEVDVMRSMYLPMARVGAGPAYTMEEGKGVMVLVGLSIPIWRGKLSAGVSEARAMQRMAAADLVAMHRMIEGEVASAHAGVQASLTRVSTLEDDIVPRARQTVDASLASYGAATVPLVSVIEAMRAMWDVEGELVREQATLELARARLRRATGTEEERP